MHAALMIPPPNLAVRAGVEPAIPIERRARLPRYPRTHYLQINSGRKADEDSDWHEAARSWSAADMPVPLEPFPRDSRRSRGRSFSHPAIRRERGFGLVEK